MVSFDGLFSDCQAVHSRKPTRCPEWLTPAFAVNLPKPANKSQTFFLNN
jgi:hypothetical protein